MFNTLNITYCDVIILTVIFFFFFKNFMSSICNSLFEALFPGSSYSTRFSALTILGSIAEVFHVPEGKCLIMLGEIIFVFFQNILILHFALFEVSVLLPFFEVLFLPYNSCLYIMKFASKGQKRKKLSPFSLIIICQPQSIIFMDYAYYGKSSSYYLPNLFVAVLR